MFIVVRMHIASGQAPNKSSLDKMNTTHYETKVLTDVNDKDGAGYIISMRH